MNKFLKILTHATLTLLFVLYIAYQFRTDPVGVLAGRQLTGEEVAYPVNWSFTDDYPLVAVETRPGNPHSVTTICFVLNDDLYIPAGNAVEKDWPDYVMNDGRARIKVGEQVYPVQLTRETDLDVDSLREAVMIKYPQYADAVADTEGTWLFRVSRRS